MLRRTCRQDLGRAMPGECRDRVHSQPIRATSVRHRCRVVCVESRGTSAADAILRITFDHIRKLNG